MPQLTPWRSRGRRDTMRMRSRSARRPATDPRALCLFGIALAAVPHAAQAAEAPLHGLPSSGIACQGHSPARGAVDGEGPSRTGQEPSGTVAAGQAEPQRDQVGWHEVQPGETLEGITEKYLGSREYWRENWRLNPEIPDPHALVPGQRIRVLLRREGPTAQITAISKDVDAKPHPDPWIPAHVGDRLKERDGVRTRIQSSAELSFDDGARLVVGEQSVVFLRDIGRPMEAVSRNSLEVATGEADVELRPAAPRPSDIEIVIGGAQARTRPGEPAQARARKSEQGAAQVMLFAGAGEVAAAGTTVELGTGTGTSVPAGGRPSPPERLLPAPSPWRPMPRASLDHANPKLSWDPVEGAASYTVEICRDRPCGQLAYRIAGVVESSAVPDSLPLGEYYWRVRGVGASGLDGYPSEPRTFTVRSLWRKPHPPRRP